VSGWVREHVERFLFVGGPVGQQAGAEVLRPLTMVLQLGHGGDPEVVMHLLGNLIRRPGRRRESGHLVDGEHPLATLVQQNKPGYRAAMRRGYPQIEGGMGWMSDPTPTLIARRPVDRAPATG
jgi:hypothetical protein